MPDCLIAARIANNMERVLREQGKAKVADKFKGFDWKTEEDAFMDGYHNHEKGGEFVTYERLRAMGTNGFQEPRDAGFKDGKIVGTKRAALCRRQVQRPRTAKPTSWRPNGGACRRPARKPRRPSGPPDQQRPHESSSGRTPISTRTTSS